MADVPNALHRIYGLIDPYFKSEKQGGIANANSPGYHASPDDLKARGRGDNYSLILPADKRGKRNLAAGIDITFNTLAEQVLVHKRLRAACTPNSSGDYDPRIECVREIIGTLDGKTVSGYNRASTGSSTRSKVGWVASGFSDPSHLWHEHISIFRDMVENVNAMLGLAEVICGVAPGTFGWKGKDGAPVVVPPVVTDPGLVEYPMPSSGEIYLDKLVPGQMDSDSVAYVQVLTAKVLGVTLLRSGDYDPATVAAAKRVQSEVFGDAPEYCDGIYGPLQIMRLIELAKPEKALKVFKNSSLPNGGGLVSTPTVPPATPPVQVPEAIVLRLKDWKGSPAGRTLIQGVYWDAVNNCYWIWQADNVTGRKLQTIVVRRHKADGTYVGYVTLVDAGHGSSLGFIPHAGGVTIVVGHAARGVTFVKVTIGQADQDYTSVKALPNGDVTVDPETDLVCIRKGTLYRGYSLKAAKAGKAVKLWECTIPNWQNRFQGHLVTGGRIYVHRDTKTKGASELRRYNVPTAVKAGLAVKSVGALSHREKWDTNPAGDEAEGAMVKGGWVFSVSRVGGDSPSRTVVCKPIERKAA